MDRRLPKRKGPEETRQRYLSYWVKVTSDVPQGSGPPIFLIFINDFSVLESWLYADDTKPPWEMSQDHDNLQRDNFQHWSGVLLLKLSQPDTDLKMGTVR